MATQTFVEFTFLDDYGYPTCESRPVNSRDLSRLFIPAAAISFKFYDADDPAGKQRDYGKPYNKSGAHYVNARLYTLHQARFCFGGDDTLREHRDDSMLVRTFCGRWITYNGGIFITRTH